MVTNQTHPEILSLQQHLENLLASLEPNLRFHVMSMFNRHVEQVPILEATRVIWLYNTLFNMLAKLGEGMSVRQRTILLETIQSSF